jgi:hypothetical protein
MTTNKKVVRLSPELFDRVERLEGAMQLSALFQNLNASTNTIIEWVFREGLLALEERMGIAHDVIPSKDFASLRDADKTRKYQRKHREKTTDNQGKNNIDNDTSLFAKTLRRIKELYEGGTIIEDIPAQINQEGHRTKRGLEWTWANVRQIIRRQGWTRS